MKNVQQTLRTSILFFLIIAINWQCARNPVTGKKEFSLMSTKQELALGKQSDPSIVGTFGKYDDKNLQKFINDKGKQMAAISHRPNLPYEFKILDSPVVNAFAVPGGYVYFTRGIMAHFNNEAEFAGVLGHEIGHITARHSAKQYSSQMIGQLGFVLGMVLSEDFRQYSNLASTGLQLAFLKFGRNHESQSDKLGVEYSTEIGYDAHEMAGFFQTLHRMRGDGDQIPTFLSTHPDPLDRERKVNEMATKQQTKDEKNKYRVNRNNYLKMIDGLVYGEDPKQGYVEGNYFYHPVMKFQFPIPGAWKTVNTPAQLQIAPADGKAVILMNLGQGKDAKAAMQAAISKDSLQVLSKKNIIINGLRAVEMTANMQKNVRLLIYMIEYDGRVYQLSGLSEIANFSRYEPTFVNTFSQFKKLTDPKKLSKKPERIRIETVQKTAPLKSVLQSFNMANDRLEELAILNGLSLTDKVEKGTLIKTLRE